MRLAPPRPLPASAPPKNLRQWLSVQRAVSSSHTCTRDGKKNRICRTKQAASLPRVRKEPAGRRRRLTRLRKDGQPARRAMSVLVVRGARRSSSADVPLSLHLRVLTWSASSKRRVRCVPHHLALPAGGPADGTQSPPGCLSAQGGSSPSRIGLDPRACPQVLPLQRERIHPAFPSERTVNRRTSSSSPIQRRRPASG